MWSALSDQLINFECNFNIQIITDSDWENRSIIDFRVKNL